MDNITVFKENVVISEPQWDKEFYPMIKFYAHGIMLDFLLKLDILSMVLFLMDYKLMRSLKVKENFILEYQKTN